MLLFWCADAGVRPDAQRAAAVADGAEGVQDTSVQGVPFRGLVDGHRDWPHFRLSFLASAGEPLC